MFEAVASALFDTKSLPGKITAPKVVVTAAKSWQTPAFLASERGEECDFIVLSCSASYKHIRQENSAQQRGAHWPQAARLIKMTAARKDAYNNETLFRIVVHPKIE